MQADRALLSVVQQINHVLSQLDAPTYRSPLPEFDGGTLGQHFRHILEFFQCLEKAADGGTVDYAARERNILFEENPNLTAAAFEAFAHALPRFEIGQELLVRAEFGAQERPAYASTLGRELLFVYDHAIHHLAMIKIGLRCNCPEVKTDSNLGVSPSTVKARMVKGN